MRKLCNASGSSATSGVVVADQGAPQAPGLHVIAAGFAHLGVAVLVAPHLVSYGPEQAVAVPTNVDVEQRAAAIVGQLPTEALSRLAGA